MGLRKTAIRHSYRRLVTDWRETYPSEWRAGCSCGWKSDATTNEHDIRNRWNRHVAEARWGTHIMQNAK